MFPGSEAQYQPYDFPKTWPSISCQFLAVYKHWGKAEFLQIAQHLACDRPLIKTEIREKNSR